MNLIDLSAELRADVIEMSHRAKAAHLASALSCVDILGVLYGRVLKLEATQPTSPHRDRFILSKGHAAAALYAALAWKGIINRQDLNQYGKQGSLLEEHPSPKQLGVEQQPALSVMVCRSGMEWRFPAASLGSIFACLCC